MQKTGIIVAMRKELDLLLAQLDNVESSERDGYEFFSGTVSGKEVVAMQCGIGKVNAALGALAMIDAYHPALIVNSGVAGGTGNGASVLDVVVASAVAYHDVWCGPGTEWGEASGCPRLFTPPVDASRVAAAIGAKHGLIASGDIFVSREADVRRILSLYPEAVAVDMESAAIAQTCYKRGVPMICLRVVSDTPGAADNISQYENFWEDAPRHTFAAVKQMVEMLG